MAYRLFPRGQLSLPAVPRRPTGAEIRAEVKSRIEAGFAVRQAERERKRGAKNARDARREAEKRKAAALASVVTASEGEANTCP